MEIGQRLRALRESEKYTQSELAKKIGLTPKMISFYENDQRTPPADILVKLSSIFQVSLDYLLLGKSSRDPAQQPALSSADEQLLRKLHSLDTRGKQAVLDTLDREYNYMNPERQDKEISS